MIFKSIIVILFFIIGLIIGAMIVIMLTNSTNNYRPKAKKSRSEKKGKKEKKNKVKERFTDNDTSITDIELDGVSDDEKQSKVEDRRKEQTKSYNYTDKE